MTTSHISVNSGKASKVFIALTPFPGPSMPCLAVPRLLRRPLLNAREVNDEIFKFLLKTQKKVHTEYLTEYVSVNKQNKKRHNVKSDVLLSKRHLA